MEEVKVEERLRIILELVSRRFEKGLNAVEEQKIW